MPHAGSFGSIASSSSSNNDRPGASGSTGRLSSSAESAGVTLVGDFGGGSLSVAISGGSAAATIVGSLPDLTPPQPPRERGLASAGAGVTDLLE